MPPEIGKQRGPKEPSPTLLLNYMDSRTRRTGGIQAEPASGLPPHDPTLTTTLMVEMELTTHTKPTPPPGPWKSKHRK